MTDASTERSLVDLTSLPTEEKSYGALLKLPESLEQELGGHIRSSYNEFKGNRMTLESEWADNVRRYESEMARVKGPWPGSSDIRPPLSRVVVDTIQALYMDSLFGKNAQVRATATRQDSVKKAKKNQDYLNYQCKEEINLYGIADKFVSDFLGPMGNAFLEPRYCVESQECEEKVITETPVNPDDPLSKTQSQEKTVTYEEITFDGVRVDLISPEFVFAAPIWEDAKEAAEKDVLIIVKPKAIDEIRRNMEGMQPKYHNKEAFETFVGKKEPNLVQLSRWKVDKITTNYRGKQKIINLATAYLWYKINDPQDESKSKMERLIVELDIDSGIVFRVIKGKCRVTHLKAFPVRGRFWGRSPLTIIKPIQKHLDAITNQIVDAGTIANLPFMFYRAGGTFNPQSFSLIPGHGYPVENPADISWSQTPRVDMSFEYQVNHCWEWVERLFGLNENVQGIAAKAGATATEALEVSKRSSVKFGTPFRRVVNQLKGLFYDIHALNQEFTPKEKTFRILGNDGVPVFSKFTQDEAKAYLNLEYEVETIYDEQLMRDTWMLAFKMWRSDPQIAMSPAYVYRLTQKAMQSVVGDTSAYLPIPEEAKLPSAEESIELIMMGEFIEPKPGIDPTHYMRVFANFIDSKDFYELSNKQQHDIFGYFAKLKLMKEVMDKYGLNNSGVFPGMPQDMVNGGGGPALNVGRQPSSKFNNMRVAESPNSMKRNGATNGTMAKGVPAAQGGPQPFSR